jgi:hypothetical protein
MRLEYKTKINRLFIERNNLRVASKSLSKKYLESRLYENSPALNRKTPTVIQNIGFCHIDNSAL